VRREEEIEWQGKAAKARKGWGVRKKKKVAGMVERQLFLQKKKDEDLGKPKRTQEREKVPGPLGVGTQGPLTKRRRGVAANTPLKQS